MNKLERQRAELLELISAYSEERWAAGWMSDAENMLPLEEETVFEHIGKAIGWPIGYRAKDGWESWEEAVYRSHKKRLEYLPKNIAAIENDYFRILHGEGLVDAAAKPLYELLEQSRAFVAAYESERV